MPGVGIESSFVSVVAEISDPVRRYLWRRTDPATTDEVLAETLVVLWRRFDQLPAEVVPWAIGVARLQLRNAERAARRQGLLQARVAALDPPPQSIDGPDAADAGEQDAVRAVLRLLSVTDQELLRLSSWEELTATEIATVLGVSTNAATIRLHRARKRFRAVWRKTHPQSGHAAVNEQEQ